MVLLDLTPLVGALPTWTPLGIAAILMVALVLLWLSMRRHIRIARRDAPNDEVDAGTVISQGHPGPGDSPDRTAER